MWSDLPKNQRDRYKKLIADCKIKLNTVPIQ